MTTITTADLDSEPDARAILTLLNEYAGDIMGGGEQLSEYTRLHLIEELRKLSTCHVVLAHVEGQPAGLAICFEGFSTFACRPILNIHDFTVAPPFRGRGLARRLLEKVEDIARDLGSGKLTLEVLEGNSVARRLFGGAGFRSYELNPEMGGALFYEKRLETAAKP